MKIPPRLIPLVEDGIIDDVIAQVRSGKEADVFVVRVGDETRCAKVYKEANNRSFRQAVQYQEGRKVQNSRSARAIGKRTRYGQKEAEASWINAEVEALNKLSAAGLRVPKPFGFYDGVLIMELIAGADGEPAPRLDDVVLTPDTALLYHEELISQVVRMLCLGLIHGDLSEFNVLVDAEGPVIIDLPQAVNAAGNNSAAMMFARDVDNLARYFGRFEPGILGLKYAKEIWDLYQKGKLTPHVELTGQFQEPTKKTDVVGVLAAIGDARKEHEDKILKKTQGREVRGPNRPPEAGRPGEFPAASEHRDQGRRPPAPEYRQQGGRPPSAEHRQQGWRPPTEHRRQQGSPQGPARHPQGGPGGWPGEKPGAPAHRQGGRPSGPDHRQGGRGAPEQRQQGNRTPQPDHRTHRGPSQPQRPVHPTNPGQSPKPESRPEQWGRRATNDRNKGRPTDPDGSRQR